jgi:YggT family protein
MKVILINLVSLIAQIANILILARVIVSWVGDNQFNPLIQQLYRLTDPLLKPFENIVPPSKIAGIDLSPIFALLAIQVAEILSQQLITALLP